MTTYTDPAAVAGPHSPAPDEAFVRLLAEEGRRRVTPAMLDDARVWIKRFEMEPASWARRLRERLVARSPWPFLRASPPADARGLLERELRKMRAFQAAGFPVAPVLYRDDTRLVLGHVAEIAQQRLWRLRRRDAAAHDRLLVQAAAALGRAHRAGLCHGRPHARDMFVAAGFWGFVDFEEEPEAVMPLATAQARDLWLLFLQVSSGALLDGTQERALAAYAEVAPPECIVELGKLVRLVSRLLPALHVARRVFLGNDGKRVYLATRFLNHAMAEMPPGEAAAGGK